MAPTDYSKKKNDELSDLLKKRSLPHTGKKAELIARLQQYDKEHPGGSDDAPSGPAPPITQPPPTVTAEDEIDWDDDGGAGLGDTVNAGTTTTIKASDPPSAAAIAAGGQGRIDNPTSVPNQAVDIDPSTTADLTIKGGESVVTDKDGVIATAGGTESGIATEDAASTTATTAVPTVDFSKGIATTDIDAELAKRKTRAARFGIQETDADALKALERAKRFGTGSKGEKEAVKGLDEALPERGRKRGRGGEKEGAEDRDGRGGKRRDAGGRRGGGRHNQDGRGQSNGGGGKASVRGLNEKDRLAAEARKKRFTAAA
ncbi:hypothetical protein MMC16_006654 [Acarospora aff. strigata]|nr:hypothetical protein [Acarospora aff. strigata]